MSLPQQGSCASVGSGLCRSLPARPRVEAPHKKIILFDAVQWKVWFFSGPRPGAFAPVGVATCDRRRHKLCLLL